MRPYRGIAWALPRYCLSPWLYDATRLEKGSVGVPTGGRSVYRLARIGVPTGGRSVYRLARIGVPTCACRCTDKGSVGVPTRGQSVYRFACVGAPMCPRGW